MGRYKSGILGAFSGRVGNIVGASWNGTDYMRSLPNKSSKPATQLQLDQRHRMRLLRGFLLGVNELVKIGYRDLKDKKTPMNDSLSYHLKFGLIGNSPNLMIDFPALLYSRGELFVPWSPQVNAISDQILNFSWASGQQLLLSKADDEAVLVVYNPAKKEFITLRNAALRAENEAQLLLPKNFAGDLVHCYMNFISSDEKKTSANVYIGPVMVA